jgi:hypothetical protein
MLVHAHDGDIDHLPAPIATKCDGRDRSARRLTSAFNPRVNRPFQFFFANVNDFTVARLIGSDDAGKGGEPSLREVHPFQWICSTHT